MKKRPPFQQNQAANTKLFGMVKGKHQNKGHQAKKVRNQKGRR